MQSVAEPTPLTGQPRPRDFLAENRGGGLYSTAVSQRVGALLAYAGSRLRLAPRALTLAGLLVGVATSAAVTALALPAAAGDVPGWVPGLVALAGWQLAYAFDCADGQLARVSGTAGPAGARLDILCDVVVQVGLVSAVAAVAVAYRPGTPVWLVAAFAGTWMVNVVTSVLQSGPNGGSLLTTRSRVVGWVKLLRDYGAVVAATGLVLTLAPQWTVAVLWVFTVVNGAFLVASVGAAARHPSREAADR